VNVGDTLSFISRQLLKSCVHRVIPYIGPSGTSETRCALAYFQRPELSAHFFDGKGKEWTGEDWYKAKYKIFRADNGEQRKTSLLTGTSGFLGEWKCEGIIM
jgi:isopenicillin N synthase-like dioxygenase